MATTMQNKILDAIEKKVAEIGLEVVIEKSFSNVGNVYLMDGFDKDLSFHFDFQNSYCSLLFYPKGVSPIGACGFIPNGCIRRFFIEYKNDTASDMKKLLNFI